MSKKKNLNKIIVIDVEATCWDSKPPSGERSEIIEIGICVLDCTERNKALRAFKSGVGFDIDVEIPRPVREKRRSILVIPKYSNVSEFCTSLTTITQELLVKEGIPFSDACDILRKEYNSQNCTWASYGDYDRKQFMKDCALTAKDVKYPFSPRHINVKNLFAHINGLEKELGMSQALDLMGYELDGTHHRGHDDAWNIAKILSSIL